MELRKFIATTIREYLNEESNSKFNDMIFYHGSDVIFNEFDRKYTTDGNIGDGFYFTPVIGLAKKYGDVIYKVKLKIKNPIYLNGVDTNFTIKDIEYIVKNIPSNLFNESKEKFLEMILSINNERNRNIEFIKSITFIDKRDRNIFEIMGYDSIIEKDFDEIIVWNPNLIEILEILK